MGIIREDIGHTSYSIMDRECIVGNTKGKPEHWRNVSTFTDKTDPANPTKWPAGTLTESYMKAHITPQSEGLLYELLQSGKLIDIFVFANNKTAVEQDLLIKKHYVPEYDNLSI